MYSTPHPTFGTRSRSQTLFHSETGSSGFSKPRLLIVEDDPALLRMMEVWLSRHFDVVTASNGRQALHETVRSSPDLVIADIDMPFMDGIELQQALSADPQLRHVPFLFVTGNIIRLGTERRYEPGGIDCIVKPFSLNDLRDRILSKLIRHAEAA